MKKKYYSVHASNENQLDDITIHKEKDMIFIHMGYEELGFTIKEAKEILEVLKKCIKE